MGTLTAFNSAVKMDISASNVEIPMTLGAQYSSIEGTPYMGEYEVDPLFTGQVLPTRNLVMTRDVTVNAIYVAKTSNPQGGNTVYIGGEFIDA